MSILALFSNKTSYIVKLVQILSRAVVEDLIPRALERKYVKLEHNPWLPLEELKSRDKFYSKREAQFNTAWSVAMFVCNYIHIN